MCTITSDMSKMESGDKFNYAVRVKSEPCDVSFTEEDGKIFDETLHTENPAQKLQKFEENYDDAGDDMQIELECTEMKPSKDLLVVVKKMEDYPQNYLQSVTFSDDYQAQSKIKLEPVGMIKKESCDDEGAKLNLDRELSEKNKTRVTKKLNCKCDMCEKKYARTHDLKRHVHSAHNKITHACNKCEKSFTLKTNLKIHIDAVHNGVTYACNKCEKSFTKKKNLRCHINAVHNGVTQACNKCDKTFTNKANLKCHIDAVHNGVTHACNKCDKSFTQRTNLKYHIDAVHNGITYKCDKCKKKYIFPYDLNRHVKKSHNVNILSCETCGKVFGQKRSLKAHIDVAHR